MNKKSTEKSMGVKSRKLKLNKLTQRDLVPSDQKAGAVKGGSGRRACTVNTQGYCFGTLA